MFGLGPQMSKADESSFSSSVDGDTFGGKAANDNKGDFQKNPPLPIMDLTAFEDLLSQQSACEIYDCMSLGDSFNCPRTWGMCLIDGEEKKPSDYSVSQT